MAEDARTRGLRRTDELGHGGQVRQARRPRPRGRPARRGPGPSSHTASRSPIPDRSAPWFPARSLAAYAAITSLPAGMATTDQPPGLHLAAIASGLPAALTLFEPGDREGGGRGLAACLGDRPRGRPCSRDNTVIAPESPITLASARITRWPPEMCGAKTFASLPVTFVQRGVDIRRGPGRPGASPLPGPCGRSHDNPARRSLPPSP